jgi:hypothetical protein
LRAENARLSAALAPGASGEMLAATARDYAAQATAIARAMSGRQAAKPAPTEGAVNPAAAGAAGVTTHGHRNHGNATAHDAALSFAWAGDGCDAEEIAKLIFFDRDVRPKALAILDTMPEAIRGQYPTPEAFYGLLLAASQLEAPPPGPDIIEATMNEVELSPGRVALRRKGSSQNFHEYQLTETGWKYVLPLAGVQGLPGILNSETLAKLARH